MLHIPIGARVTRIYYALSGNTGFIGPEFDTQHEANVAALRKWGGIPGDFPLNPPRVDQRMVFEFPDGSGVDTIVATETVYPNLTTPAPTSRQQRAALAETATRQLNRFHAAAGQSLDDADATAN